MIRTKLGYTLLLVLMGLLAILYDDYVMLLSFLLVLIIPIPLWIVAKYLAIQVTLTMLPSDYVVTKGEPYTIIIRVKNASLFPISSLQLTLGFENLYAKAMKLERIMVVVNSRSEQDYELSVTSDYCGIVRFYIKKILIRDYLGLWSIRKKEKSMVQVSILPKFHHIVEPLALANPSVLIDSEHFSGVKSGDDTSELYGVREYEEGDKMNRIHWKLSLKEDKLMVKQFGLPIDCSTAILIDFNFAQEESRLSRLDAVIEVVYSLSFSMLLQGQIHFVCWYDPIREVFIRQRIEKEEELYETLALLYQSEMRSMEKSVVCYHEAVHSKEQYTNLFYVAVLYSGETKEELSQMRKSAWTHMILVDQEERKEDKKEDKRTMIRDLEHGFTLSILHCNRLSEELPALAMEWRGR